MEKSETDAPGTTGKTWVPRGVIVIGEAVVGATLICFGGGAIPGGYGAMFRTCFIAGGGVLALGAEGGVFRVFGLGAIGR